jgi:hypothetical protein
MTAKLALRAYQQADRKGDRHTDGEVKLAFAG